MTEVEKYFYEQFGRPAAVVVRAPGRLELLGNHTDYNEGLVLSLAIDRYVFMAASPRNDGRIVLASSAFSEREQFMADRVEKNSLAPWANYVKGVLAQLRKRGVHFGGFNAAIHGTIPPGAGMSSSAALEVATALAVRRLYPYRLTEFGIGPPPSKEGEGLLSLTREDRLYLARLCQAAENEFVGVQCGILDQVSSLFGKEQHAMELDCMHDTVTLVPMIGGISIVVCNSGVKHALADGGYNELRRNCEAAARALGVRSLRSVDVKMLAASRDRLTEREHACAYHIVGENQRVIFGEKALRSGEGEAFGQYLFQSHESSRDSFKNSCAELDLLVELAKRERGCWGARLTGGGFGGATINLVEATAARAFARSMEARYEEETGRKVEPMICQIVDGAG